MRKKPEQCPCGRTIDHRCAWAWHRDQRCVCVFAVSRNLTVTSVELSISLGEEDGAIDQSMRQGERGTVYRSNDRDRSVNE